jgi:putative ABC transport system substrate-binding protein
MCRVFENAWAEKPTRRELCGALLGLGAAWPLSTKAQQAGLPVIGFLSSGSPRAFGKFLKAFQQGLSEVGFVEGRNVTFVYRWAEGHFDELDSLAAELVSIPVALIAASGGLPSAQAAKKATDAIPIVAILGFDPVKFNLAQSYNKPGGNLTGTSIFTTELAPKRLSLLYDLDPGMEKAAVLVNPRGMSADVEVENLVNAANTTGRPLAVLEAGTQKQIEEAFASAAQQGIRGLLVSADPLFMARREQVVVLAAAYNLPVMYAFREFVDAGGLMSYGPNLVSAYRVAGVYAGRILKGMKPSELPIETPTKFEFLINLKTAKRLGLVIPPHLLAITDEIVEQ